MKIAILFRGPVRPNPRSVYDKYRHFMEQFRGMDAEIHTYLATWRYWHHHRAMDLAAQDIFDNVLVMEEPTLRQVKACTNIDWIANGMPIHGVYNMYHQSKIALDLIMDADQYDYIVHTRTDLWMWMDQMDQWFCDSYVAPHVHPLEIMCDQFGVAPAAVMHRAWDHGTKAELGKMLEAAEIPESVLQMMIERAGITAKKGPYKIWQLDPLRGTA